MLLSAKTIDAKWETKKNKQTKNPFEEQSNLTLEGEVNAGGSLSGPRDTIRHCVLSP